ncbi:ABC transporter substrate-binding protein [Kurthia sibirica]|uniref:BMP family ABC transporter substrate-binding protein n=1 Tax=Kurthia sibirica TaxID=202750 RepID=A0A2U3AK42_9BACL|nr:ABC transporter substrate-binding protein [Kurthia sibirica]PWI24864.1 BMP family ABC transporter substrate-binding protein [Kurthia sibirica]GEK35208.1 LacI family transcriptional regulator [Kurthia sibirica]
MKKKSLFLSSLLAVAMILGACGSDEKSTGDKDADAKSDQPYIAIVSKGFQHQFWQAVKKGAEKAADEYNVKITFEGPESEAQVDKQIEMLKAALDKKPQAIGFAALDSKASINLLEEAKSKKIPVVAFDSGVESDIPVATASTDNEAAAALAADKMAEAIDGKGEIALIVQDQTSLTAKQRRDGFKNQIESKYPDIKIVDIQYGGGDHLKSTDLAKTIMQAHPDLKGMFGTNEGSAIGVVNAVQEMKKTGKVIVVGFDSGKQQLDAIRSGLMYGAVTQNPEGIGYETVKAAVETLDGKTVDKQIDTGFYWYDKENIDSDEIKAAVYE